MNIIYMETTLKLFTVVFNPDTDEVKETKCGIKYLVRHDNTN